MNDIAFSVIIKNDGISDIIFKTIMLKGEDGNSISSIEKTSTSGLVDTYTIYLTDGTVGGTFTVTNGTGSTYDDELDATSTNAVQNKVVKSAIDDLDGRVSDLEDVTIDTELSTTSTNAVENRAIKNAIDNLTAENIAYDNTSSGLTAVDVQSAIDEIHSDLNDEVETIDNKFSEFTEIAPTTEEWVEITEIGNQTDKRAIYNTQYNRVAFSGNQTYFGTNVYPVTAGRYKITGYGYDTVAGVLAVVGNANIVESGASYCSLLQIINTGDTTNYTWHTVEVEIEQDGYLYVNYSYVSGDRTSKVEKEITVGTTVVTTDNTLTDEYLPANSKAVGDAIRNAIQTHGIIKNGTSFVHFSYSHDNKFIFRTIAPVGANSLYDYKSVAIGHFEDGEAIIDSTFWSAFTDQIGPISLRLQGDSGSNYWTGGVHTKNVGGTEYPTAEMQSINVYVDGVDITNLADGIYYGDARIITQNKLYAPATITGADLSTATIAVLETRTFILIDTLKVQVKLEFKENVVVGLYYGMQGQDNHANTILLPTARLELSRADMTSGAISNSKEWCIMLSDNNHWHFDMLLSHFGLGEWNENDGSSSYGRLSHYSNTKIYFVLCSGGTFNQGDIFFWEGEYKTYHD